jgi:hypothetical protein
MTLNKERAADHLLMICRRIQKRFKDGHMPTFGIYVLESRGGFDGKCSSRNSAN